MGLAWPRRAFEFTLDIMLICRSEDKTISSYYGNLRRGLLNSIKCFIGFGQSVLPLGWSQPAKPCNQSEEENNVLLLCFPAAFRRALVQEPGPACLPTVVCLGSGSLGTCAGEGSRGVAEAQWHPFSSVLNAGSQETVSCACEECGCPPGTSKLQRGKTVLWADVESFWSCWIGLIFTEKEDGTKNFGGLYLFLVTFPLYPWGAKIIKMLEELQHLTIKIDWKQRISTVWSQSYIELGCCERSKFH